MKGNPSMKRQYYLSTKKKKYFAKREIFREIINFTWGGGG